MGVWRGPEGKAHQMGSYKETTNVVIVGKVYNI